jgi:hypothetical protein
MGGAVAVVPRPGGPDLDRGGLDRSRAVRAVAVSGDRGPGLASDDADYPPESVLARGLGPSPAGAVVRCRWQGRGVAFPTTAESRLACTLLARRSEGHEDGWYIVTDLPPEVAEAAWYGLRMWIEHGFEQFKSGGWQWQKSRMTDPDRAGRIWLAMAVATHWVVAVGGAEDAGQGPIETMPALKLGARGDQASPGAAARGSKHHWESPGSPRLVSVLRKGMATVLAALIMGCGVVMSSWYPEPWPEISPGIQVEHHEQTPDIMGKTLPL